jgi:site-specific DNA-methyltransferase (adenine-specific)
MRVLDNVAGSFTTGVACVNTKRHFIGIEKEREYYDIGVKRIAEAKSRIANTFAEGR